MTPVRRARLVVVALAALAVWPLLQHGLARRFQVNPWKLGGFAMYTAPSPPLQIFWVEVGEAGPQRIAPEELPADLRRDLLAFEGRRHALGALEDPEPVARQVLATRPASEAVMVVIRRFELDAETARFHVREVREIVAR